MFIDPLRTAGFKRSLFNSIVVPRPIGWISSIGPSGIANLAPFSQFNLVSTAPPVVMFACNQPEDRPDKDTIANVRGSGEFVTNFVSWHMREAMNRTSSPVARGVDEFVLAGLEKLPSSMVAPPRVAGCPAHMECRVLQIIEIPPEHPGETRSTLVLGRVVGLHLDDGFVDADGRFDSVRAEPVSRLGGFQYGGLGPVVELPSQFGRAS